MIFRRNNEKGEIKMTNYKKYEESTKELNKLKEAREEIKNKYYNKQLSYNDCEKALKENEEKQDKLTIKLNVLKNNLLLEVHNKLMIIYKDVYKKYENKSIGEKRQEEIRKTFENQISDIFNYSENIAYYNSFFLYFHCKYDGERTLFEVEIEKLNYNFCYYVENEEIKSRYIIEYPEYVENEEEEAERLYNLFNNVVSRKKEIEKELDELKEQLSSNFKKNLYDDKITRTTRNMTFYW